MNKGKWSYHPNWNFGVKNFKITNFRLNNIFSTIFYGFYGFTARIFDILWLLLKCGDFTRIRHFRNIPMNIGQMVSMTHHIWLTVWLIHTKYKITTLGSKRVMKVLEYFGHEAFLEYSSFITEINELGYKAFWTVTFRFCCGKLWTEPKGHEARVLPL